QFIACDALIFYCSRRTDRKRIPFAFCVVGIAWRSHMLSCTHEFSIGIDDTAASDTKKPGSKGADKVEGRQGFIHPYHGVLNNIIPGVFGNVCCLFLDTPLHKLTAFVPLPRYGIPLHFFDYNSIIRSWPWKVSIALCHLLHAPSFVAG